MSEEIKKEEQLNEEEVKVTKTITLSFNQLLVAGSIILSIIGGSFGVGMKVQNSINEVEVAKINCEKQEEITKIKTTLGKDLQITQSDLEFYKNRYSVYKERLDKCISQQNFSERMIRNNEILSRIFNY